MFEFIVRELLQLESGKQISAVTRQEQVKDDNIEVFNLGIGAPQRK